MKKIIKFIKKCWKVNKWYTIAFAVGNLDVITGCLWPEPIDSLTLFIFYALIPAQTWVLYTLLEDVRKYDKKKIN